METFIVHAPDAEKSKALKAFFKALGLSFEKAKEDENPYNADFVKKVLESREEVKKGKTIKVDLDDIRK